LEEREGREGREGRGRRRGEEITKTYTSDYRQVGGMRGGWQRRGGAVRWRTGRGRARVAPRRLRGGSGYEQGRDSARAGASCASGR
jgi:hypothetical protein